MVLEAQRIVDIHSRSETSEVSDTVNILEVQPSEVECGQLAPDVTANDHLIIKPQVKKGSRFDWLFVVVFLFLLLGCIFLLRGVQEADAHLIILIESVRPRFAEKDPLAKFDSLFSAALRNYEAERYREAIILLDAASKETAPYGKSNVYLANVLSLKGECLFSLGEITKARKFYKQSIQMWCATRGRRTQSVGRVWELLAETYLTNDNETCRKCLNMALWSYDHSIGPFSYRARHVSANLQDKLLNCDHPSFGYQAGDDICYESGVFLAERLKKFDAILELQDRLIVILGGARKGKWAAFDFAAPIWEFNKILESSKKYYGFGASAAFPPFDEIERRIDFKARMFNRQASLLHLLGRHSEAKMFDIAADQCFENLRTYRSGVRKITERIDSFSRNQNPADWFPLE